MKSEVDAYARIIRRIILLIGILGAAGSIAAIAIRGWKFGIGFLLGACISYLSFWRWRKLVEVLGGTPKRRSTMWMVVRFLMLVAAAYAIVNYLEVNPVAVFLGLLVSAAAVVVSIIFELIYAGT